jgi:hypothetical protein
MANLSKIEKLTNVRTKLSKMYDSYDEKDFSSPEYEIDEHLAGYLLTHSNVKVNLQKLHTIVRYYLDDSIENLYINGVSEFLLEDISQTELEEIIELILKH